MVQPMERGVSPVERLMDLTEAAAKYTVAYHAERSAAAIYHDAQDKVIRTGGRESSLRDRLVYKAVVAGTEWRAADEHLREAAKVLHQAALEAPQLS